MTGSGMLDLVIGLLFVFLVFSLVVSAANEAITRGLAWRSRHLWRALRRLLDGKNPPLSEDQRPVIDASTGPGWTDRLYAHPLIRQLERRVPTSRSRIAHIPTSDFGRALIDLLVPNADGSTSIAELRTAVQSLPDNAPLRGPLLAMLNEVGNEVIRFRETIDEWFNARMEFLSQAYRRHVRWLLVGVGLIVAVVFNVDAIGAAQRLYRDEALRTAVAQQAVAVVAACENQEDPVQCTRDQVAKIDPAIRLPVGWPDADGIDFAQVVGWVLAGIALGQGAPFWFDLLRRASRLRR